MRSLPLRPGISGDRCCALGLGEVPEVRAARGFYSRLASAPALLGLWVCLKGPRPKGEKRTEAQQERSSINLSAAAQIIRCPQPRCLGGCRVAATPAEGLVQPAICLEPILKNDVAARLEPAGRD